LTHTSAISLWVDLLPEAPARAPLPGNRQYDVAIVGAGYTGLWAAWYLKTLAPDCSVCILEAQQVAYGASGRNGGWMMGAFEGEAAVLSGLQGELQRAAIDAVHSILPEVEAVLAQAGIDCDYQRGGGIYAAARYPEQLAVMQDSLRAFHGCGYSEVDYRWLEPDELSARLQIEKPLGAVYTPHVARIQPARLARGLADAVQALGVDIYENTRVERLGDGELLTDRGSVQCQVKVLAVEGFNLDFSELKRRVLPVQSRIIATEPLTDQQWQAIGLEQREVFCDSGPLVNYGQRTAGNRLVFGARGSYQFGGAPQLDFAADNIQFAGVEQALYRILPQVKGSAITHRWGGNLGMPRSGLPHAVFDQSSGLATAGGYSGEGVGASNLMARSLVDMILGRSTPLVEMPWCHRNPLTQSLRRWEMEPLRYLGYKATDWVLALEEASYARPAPAWRRSLVGGASALLARLRR
jgi:glycine/D-amino acid oxidase-like deaminating enzyme